MPNKSKDEIRKSLSSIRSGKAEPLLDMRRYCKENNESIDGFLDYIPAPVFEEFDERQQYIASSDFDSVELDFQFDGTLLEQLQTVAILMDSEFRMVEHQNQLMVVRVIDEAKKLVEPLFEGDVQSVMIRSLCQKVHSITREPISPAMSRYLIDLWTNHSKALDAMPKPMAPLGEDVWTFHRPHWEPDSTVLMPNWQNIMDRMSDPEAWAAWVWAVYSSQYKGRQILWLCGPNGQDGKSTIASIIGKELFGSAHKAISNATVSGDRRFVLSHFETSALVIYPDASNRMVLLTELFKSIANAGDDPVLIERKGKAAYSTYINARLWINSNFTPVIPDAGYATSRLLYIHISAMRDEKPDPNVKDLLRDQLPGLLHYARQAYGKRCERDYIINVNEPTQRLVSEITGNFHEIFENAFEKHFVKCKGERVQCQVVQDRCREERINGQQYGKFRDYLEEFQGVVRKKFKAENGRSFYCDMRLRTPADDKEVPTLPDSNKPNFGGTSQ